MSIIEDLIKPKQYLPYDKKIELATTTIAQSRSFKPLIPNRSRLFIINLMNVYTDLEVSVNDFDVLSQNCLLEPILSSFEKEYNICSSILQMCLQEEGGS